MKKLDTTQSWKGVWTALVTPFTPQGELDLSSFKKLIELQIADGITGLVIAGSTGEGSLQNDEEYFALIQKAVEIVNARIPLVAGLGIGGTKEALHRGELAKKAGASGLLASPPAYIKPTVRGLVQHFLTVAKIGLPVCLYDVPSRSAIGIQDEVIDTLLNSNQPEAKNILALKDATGNPDRIANKVLWKERLALLSGDDESFPEFLKMGGHGIISVASHFTAKYFINLLKEQNAENLKRFESSKEFIRALYWESNPIPVKTLLYRSEVISHNFFQAPLTPMKEDLLEKLYELKQKL